MDESLKGAETSSEASLLRRLRYTPLRDVLRLRLTGRLDLDRLVAASGLPASLGAVVSRVARKTRLWRLEKADVARELIAHFKDGLETGATAAALQRSFGDARTAAKLIRKAKKRQRPLAWRVMKRTVQGVGLVLGLLIALYAVIAIRFFMGRPTPTRNYVAEINQPILAIPESERAWPVYREGLLKMPKLWALQRERSSDREGQEPSWDRIVAALREENEGVALFREAARQPSLGFPVGDVGPNGDLPPLTGTRGDDAASKNAPMTIHILLPYLHLLRAGTRILAWDAQQAAIDGDGALVTADVEAMLGVAEHVTQVPTLIGEVVSFSIGRLAFETLGEALHQQPPALSDAQLQALAHRIAALRGGGRMVVHLDGERMWFDDLIQRAYTDNGAGDGRMTRAGVQLLLGLASMTGSAEFMDVAMPVAGVVSATRSELLAEFDRVFALSQLDFSKPLWELERFAGDAEVSQMHGGSLLLRAKYFPIWLLMPALAKSHVTAEQTTQRRDAMLVAIALELSRRAHGGVWPQTLEELVPKYLPSVPPDRFDGKPLKYRLIDARPVVYSVGTDRDDDGGVAPVEYGPRGETDASWWLSPAAVEQRKAERDASLPDGDWVLWPTAVRK